jgi:regulatory protein
MVPENRVFSLAVRYIGVRPRSVYEVRQYLERKGIESAEVEAVVERLSESGLLDDKMFAESWIASRQALKPRSRVRLQQELAVKGVAKQVIQEALAELGEEGELQALERIIAKKRRLGQYQDPEKLMSYLLRQGYSFDKAKEALTRLHIRES